MIRNYFQIALRNFRKNFFFSVANIFGLTIGLTCCMLIAIYLYHEFTYDHHHQKIDRLYKVATTSIIQDKEENGLATPSPVGPALQKEFPEIEGMARSLALFIDDKTLLQYKKENENKSFYETNGYLADSSFFRLFDYDFAEGNSFSALNEPNSIVISNEIAQKLFGNGSAINRVIHINSSMNGSADYKITGVFKPKQQPTHIDARFFLSMSSGNIGNFVKQVNDFATNNMFNTYILLKPGAKADALQKKFPAFVEKYMRKDLVQAGFNKKQFLVSVKDLHLRSGVENTGGNLSYLYILACIALFILLIASINFMNLATAHSAKRATEVGIRKVLGAEKKSLAFQFLCESLLFAIFSFFAALILVYFLLPLFSRITATQLSFNSSNQFILLAGFVVLTIITGLIAGSYPALYLSSFKPIKVLKGKFSNSLSAVNFRKTMVVFQFVISTVLIIGALVVGKQMNYMFSKDLGFIKDQQIIIPLRSTNAKDAYNALKNSISQNEQVVSVGASQYYPGIFNATDISLYSPGKTIAEAVYIKTNFVDDGFLQTLNIRPVAGRLYSPEFVADTGSTLILNETAIQKLQFESPSAAINQYVLFDWEGKTNKYKIIGVVKDFHFEGLKQSIAPFSFQKAKSDFNYIVAHIKPANTQSVLKYIQSSWQKLNPNEPFEYSFLDQDFQKNYEAEIRLSLLIRYFMVIAICICCLGLFGLVAFSVEQRTKEIGVRKVLGAGAFNILGLLSKDFIRLVLIGNLIALPIAWYLMKQWLQDFTYRTSLNWWVFAITIALSILIAMATIGLRAIKAIVTNPVKSLRSE